MIRSPARNPPSFRLRSVSMRNQILSAAFLLCMGCGSASPASSPPSTSGNSSIDSAGSATENNGGEAIKPIGEAVKEPKNGESEPQAASKPAPDRPLNVLLILVDSMRADMPWAGYPREIAPNLTALEKQSVSYSRNYSISSYTAKSVGGLLAGKYPSTLRRSGFFFTRYSEADVFFAELLQQNGAHTMAGHAHMYMKRGNMMDQGFADWRVVDGIDFDSKTDRHITSQKLTPMAIEQLKAVPEGKPFFMYLHYMDPHDVYMKHEEAPDFGNKPRDRYDQEIFYTDLWIGKLLDYCKQQPWWEKTAIIVTADHGEAFGEHRMHRHAFHLWDVLTHVPLFVSLPGQTAHKRIETPRSAIDLGPTILDLMGVEAPAGEFHGASLVEELYGREEPKPRPVLLDLPADSNNPKIRAIIHGDYKLMVYETGWKKDLYNLKDDPGETKDLSKQEPERFKEMVMLFDAEWGKLKLIQPHGGNKLMDGTIANGPK